MLPYAPLFSLHQRSGGPSLQVCFWERTCRCQPLQDLPQLQLQPRSRPLLGQPTSDVWINRALALSAVLTQSTVQGYLSLLLGLQHFSPSLSVCSCFPALRHAFFSRAPRNKHQDVKLHLRVVFPENSTCHETLLNILQQAFLCLLNMYSLDAWPCAKYQDTVRSKTKNDLWSHGTYITSTLETDFNPVSALQPCFSQNILAAPALRWGA